MQTLLHGIFTSLGFVFIYQFMAPFFSSGAVGFQPVSFWLKLAFSSAMSFGVSILVLVVATFGTAVVIPATLLNAGPSLLEALPFIILVLFITVLQISHWLVTLALGKLMPNIIRVESSAAAFKSAWAPTLVFGLIYGVPLAFLTLLGVALHTTT